MCKGNQNQEEKEWALNFFKEFSMKEKELPNYSGALFLSLGSMDLFTQTFFDVSLHFGDSGFGTL